MYCPFKFAAAPFDVIDALRGRCQCEMLECRLFDPITRDCGFPNTCPSNSDYQKGFQDGQENAENTASERNTPLGRQK